MSPEELDSLANDIEANLKRDLLLVKGFQYQSFQDHHRRKKLFILKILCLFNIARIFILNFLCLFPSYQASTDLRVIFVDTFFAFRSFGCLSNQILLLGFIFLQNFSDVMHEAEKNGQLHVISHIKDHRKFQLTHEERIKFATYLKWMKTMRLLFMYVVLLPLLSFLAVGACLSSLEHQSITFTAASIFVTVIFSIQMYFGCIWAIYVFMLPVHSNNFLSIQFNRLFERIENLQRVHNAVYGNLKFGSETREKRLSLIISQRLKRAQQKVKKRQSILKTIENLLRQIDQHNEIVKHILDKGTTCAVPAIGLAIVFFLGERGNLLRHTFSAGVVLGGLVYYVSLLKTRHLYTLSLRLSSHLHGMQVRLGEKGMKSQLQILRLIQKMSDCESWHHSIGYTVGDRGSLSPNLVLSSFLQTISIALTFLNSKNN